MNEPLRATAFHARTAAANRLNAWTVRNGVTLPLSYGETANEALAARTRVGIADLGARWQVMLEGPRVVEFLQRILTCNPEMLPPGHALKALWLADGGGLRGAGVIARYGKEAFWLVSVSPDPEWIWPAAAAFGVVATNVSVERHGLAVIGPYAERTLEAAGIRTNLNPLAFRVLTWQGSEIILSRFGEHGGYELWCGPDDGLLLWDSIVRVGAAFGLDPIGAAAMDVLDIEAGVPRPHRDYIPAQEGFAPEPSPLALGMQSLIEPGHARFNGHQALAAAPALLVGVEIESEHPAPYTPLLRSGLPVGHTLASCYSPTLQRAIALAQVSANATEPGTPLMLTLPPSLVSPTLRIVAARVAALPFLEPPASMRE